MLEVEIEAREDAPWWFGYAAPVVTVLAALTVGGGALLALGVDPIAAYTTMFVGTLTTSFGLTETLVKAVPLVLTGLAVYLPLRAGLWNIGAEGQLYVGAVVGTYLGLELAAPMVVRIPVMLLGAAAGAALWGAIPGYLRARYDVNEIIVTLMFTFIGVRLASYLVHGPMRGGQGNFPVSATLPDAAQLPALVGSAHVGVLLALGCVAAIALLVRRTRFGYEVTFVGSNADAAEQAGISTFHVYVLVLALGGALAGLAGAVEIAGVQGRLRPEFSPGYGFTAIPIALLGRNGASRVALAAVFFALLFVGGSSMELAFGVPSAIVDIIQALVILFLITAEFFKSHRVRIEFDRSPAATTAAEEA
jgi:ABC-type uncharacterized transport system permease subunit